jgi:hypothetical protein
VLQTLSAVIGFKKGGVMRTKSLLLVLATCVVFVAGSNHPVQASSDDDYIYCSLQDNTHSTVYFSDVFAGNYSNSLAYQNAFHDNVHGNYSNVIGTASCFFEKDSHAAKAKKDNMKASERNIYEHIIETGWSY